MSKFLLFVCFLFSLASVSSGQNSFVGQLRDEFDRSYGLDVLLNNGKKYFPDTRSVVGDPFWRSPDFFVADISVSGKLFQNQQLKFDLEKQNFILFYSNYNGQSGQIILNAADIDSVSTGGVVFVVNRNPGIKQQFIQKIYQGRLSCYIGWYKELKFNITGVNTGYEYSKELKDYYLVNAEGQARQFTRKSSLLDLFSENVRPLIRKFMAVHKIRFKKMSETELKSLITYCDQIAH